MYTENWDVGEEKATSFLIDLLASCQNKRVDVRALFLAVSTTVDDDTAIVLRYEQHRIDHIPDFSRKIKEGNHGFCSY